MEDQKRGNMTVKEAGQKGGRTTREEYGPEFYHQIGEKAHRDHPDLAQRAGKKGGQRVRELVQEGKESEER